ncbi:hypothetical protein DPMN_059663 [Dreissena polymorpha]|uniref:Uncharacterized protein n=1 Tax=Dreissena polymorpha TaxID=45954 RepID=A0A9D4HGU2_DREPO|nr:hypothetical protein DPMN_059663 [Dreissena polymorpha]
MCRSNGKLLNVADFRWVDIDHCPRSRESRAIIFSNPQLLPLTSCYPSSSCYPSPHPAAIPLLTHVLPLSALSCYPSPPLLPLSSPSC